MRRRPVGTEVFEFAADGDDRARRGDLAAVGATARRRRIGQGRRSTLTVPRPETLGPGRRRISTWRGRPFAQGDKLVDVYDQPFGFRTIEFTPRDGFKLNGKRVPIQGHVQSSRPRRRSARLSTCGRWSGSSRSSRRWAATPCGPRTIRPRRSCSTWPTAWASW